MDQSALPSKATDMYGPADHRDAGRSQPSDTKPAWSELRLAPRVTVLIRSAKLITKQGEFVGVVRDASQTGVRIRLFHKLLDEKQMALQMPSGNIYELHPVRTNGDEVGFEFAEPVDVEQLICEASEYPKRALRFDISFPIIIAAAGEKWDGVVENISQQGARLRCSGRLAIDQSVQIMPGQGVAGFPDIRAKVRWRGDNSYGVVFDDTFSLSDFAVMCMVLQCPMLAD